MIRRGCSLLLGLLILFSVDVFLAGAAPPLPRPGSVDIVLLVDNSPSTKETDPSNLRIEAARFLLDYLEGTGLVSGTNIRAGVVSFGGELGTQVLLSPISGGAVRDAIVPEEIPYTDFRPPLAAAVEQFRLRRSFDLTAATAVVLFTDGNPELGPSKLSDADTRRYFRGESILSDSSQLRLNTILQTLKDAGTNVLVVSVSDRDRALWEESLAGFGRFVFIQDIGDLPGLYHDFAAQLMGSLPGQSQQLSAGQPYSITLQPHLEQVTFTILKDAPETTVTVRAIASGAESAPTAGGAGRLHAIYAIPAPEGGTWEVKTSGDAQLWVDQRLPTLQVEGPGGPQVLGQAVSLSAQLLVGRRAIEDDKLTLDAQVVGPDGSVPPSDVIVTRQQDHYDISLNKLAVQGEYTVTLSAQWDKRPIEVLTTPFTFGILSVPRIVSLTVDGKAGSGQPLMITLSIANHVQFAVDIVPAHIISEDGTEVAELDLVGAQVSPDADVRLYMGSTTSALQAGLYSVSVDYAGFVVAGLPFSLSARAPIESISAAPMPTSTATLTAATSVTVTPEGTPPAGGPGGKEPRSSWRSLLPVLVLAAATMLLSAVLWRLKKQTEDVQKRLRTSQQEADDRYAEVRSQVETLKEAKEHTDRGKQALAAGDKDTAERELTLGLDKARESSRLHASATGQVIIDCVREMLDGVYKDDPFRQRDFIRKLASEPDFRIHRRVLAEVLRDRWVEHPELFINEYYDVLRERSGLELVEAITQLERRTAWDSSSQLGKNADALLKVANYACALSAAHGGPA